MGGRAWVTSGLIQHSRKAELPKYYEKKYRFHRYQGFIFVSYSIGKVKAVLNVLYTSTEPT